MLRFQKVKFKPTFFKKSPPMLFQDMFYMVMKLMYFKALRGCIFLKKTGQILNPSLLPGLSFFLFSFQIIFASGFCVSFFKLFLFSLQRIVFFFLHFVLCVGRECFYCLISRLFSSFYLFI